MDFNNNDYMLLDVEKASLEAGGGLSDASDKNRPMIVSMVPAFNPPSVIPNGYDGSRQNSTPINSHDPSASLPKPVEDPSREPSLLAKAVAEQFNLDSPGQSKSPSDDETSDDLAFQKLARSRQPPVGTLPTGLCYDVRMRYHCELDPPKQRLDFHPEDPRRIYSIYREFCLSGLVDDPQSTRPIVPLPLQRVTARNATKAEICLVHDVKHFDFIESTKGIHRYSKPSCCKIC